MAEHNDFGKEAENQAVFFLEQKGYNIIARNYRYLKAELDIIAEKDNTLVVVEVKARQHSTLVEPHEAVNKRKIKLIISATNEFLQSYPKNVEVRFDIISIIKTTQDAFEITHIENAFESIDG
ncbi:YraN family protein [Riemerella anatipestifer]|nr:YraN family protein [Riemerella anatipestifer]